MTSTLRGGRGVPSKADIVSNLRKGGCVNLRTRGDFCGRPKWKPHTSREREPGREGETESLAAVAALATPPETDEWVSALPVPAFVHLTENTQLTSRPACTVEEVPEI